MTRRPPRSALLPYATLFRSALLSVSAKVWAVKVAVTERAALMVTEQEAAVPVHAPLQPLEVAPAASLAAMDTPLAPAAGPEQVAPQLMPAGAAVHVPAHVPG